MASSAGSPSKPTSAGPAQVYRKACDSCHASKVRCAPDPFAASGSCRRCVKYRLGCTHSHLGTRRKPAQTSNQRVAQLERQIQLLLQARGYQPPAGPGRASSAQSIAVATSAAQNAAADAHSPQSPPVEVTTVSVYAAGAEEPPLFPTPTQVEGDVIDKGFLTAAQADELVRAFHTHLHARFVSVWLPKGIPISDLRRAKPILWLSVLCASSASLGWDVSAVVSAEMDALLKVHLTLTAEPSLEVLRATLIYVFHHYEPTQNRLQQFLHYHKIGAAMVVRLAESDVPLHSALDVSRELLVWYWCSIIGAMRTRGVPLIWCDELIQRSLQVVEHAGEHVDRVLIAWVSLARITVETAMLLEASAGESRDAVILAFDKRLRQWIADLPTGIFDEALLLEYHFNVIFISELKYPAAHGGSSYWALRILPPLGTLSASASEVVPFDGRIRECVESAHHILNIFTGLDPGRIRCIGISVFSRVFHALRVLFLVLYLGLSGLPSPVGVDSLRTGSHIEALFQCLHRASNDAKCGLPTIWLYALKTRLLPWYQALCRKANHSLGYELLENLESEGLVELSSMGQGEWMGLQD